MQQLILLGTFFVLPVYLQVVLGLDAFETGKRLFPMSIAMLVAALAGPRLAARLAPQAGRADRARGTRRRRRSPLLGTIDVELDERGFAFGARALRGRRRPAALAARERDHVVGRPVADERGGRAPGHGAEPRRLPRHGADRRGPARRADEAASSSRIEHNPAVRGGTATDLRRGRQGHPRSFRPKTSSSPLSTPVSRRSRPRRSRRTTETRSSRR